MSSGSNDSGTPNTGGNTGNQKPVSNTKPNVSTYAYHSPTDPRFNPEPDDIAVRLGLSPLRDLRTTRNRD